MARSGWAAILAGIAAASGIGLSGCQIDVDLTAMPLTVSPGEEVDIKVKVTNRFNCPVGGVTAIVIPFVPRGTLINQIPDPDIRDRVQRFVDDFCAPGEFDLDFRNGSEAFCEREGGDLVCHVDPGFNVEIPGGLQENLDLGISEGNDQVRCQSEGGGITCRIPKVVLDEAQETLEQQGEQLPLVCVPAGPIWICVSLQLSPGEMQMDDFKLTAGPLGTFHHFVVAFATQAGGVCRTGIPRLACDDDDDCDLGLIQGECEIGICSGSSTSLNGRGCDPNVSSQCTNGTCTVCGELSGEGLLTGVACETTVVAAPAPILSHVALVTLAGALLAFAVFVLRRRRIA